MNRLTIEQRDHLRGLIQGIRGASVGHINTQGVYSPGVVKTVGAGYGQDYQVVDRGILRFITAALEAALKEDEPPNRYTYPGGNLENNDPLQVRRIMQCVDCGAMVYKSGVLTHDRWHQNQ